MKPMKRNIMATDMLTHKGLSLSSVDPSFMMIFLYFFSSGFVSETSESPYPVGLWARIVLPR